MQPTLTPWAFALILLASMPIYAQTGEHPLVSQFPDSELVEVDFEADANYRLILGSLQRTRGVVVPQDSERLRGAVTRLRYEVTPGFNGEDVLTFFQAQFAERGYEVQFSCGGSECGSSNYWANDVFRKRVLYGPERNQYFMALRADDPQAHLVLYIITRGNRRLYYYLEIVEKDGDAATITLPVSEVLADIAQSGSAVIPELTFTNDRQMANPEILDAIAREMAAQPELNFYVVAHLSGEQDLQQLMNRSTARAQTVRQQLINLGVDANRLVARGLGPLAPSCPGTDCTQRVELVLRQDTSDL